MRWLSVLPYSKIPMYTTVTNPQFRYSGLRNVSIRPGGVALQE